MARKKKQTTDLPQENIDNPDDTFGLPEVQYEPLNRDEPITPDDTVITETPEVVIVNVVQPVTPEPPAEEPSPYKESEPFDTDQVKEKEFVERHEFVEEEQRGYTPTYSYKQEKTEVWPKVLGVILVLFLLGGAVYYFAYYHPQKLAKEEKERRELLTIQEEARRKEDARLAEAKRLEDERAGAVVKETAAPKTGAIETLSGRSGRYYVVIASSIDGDLIMDYAKKLSQKGVSTKIIPPFRKSNFHRLAVADGDTYESTQTAANELKGADYGNKVWVVKY